MVKEIDDFFREKDNSHLVPEQFRFFKDTPFP